MLATPLQLASAFSAIANGGTLFKPEIVKSIATPDGKILQEFTPEIRGRVDVPQDILKKIREALQGVVNDKKGTARGLRNKRLKIAGKTGTAQVSRLIEREHDLKKIHYKLRDHAWFVGFAPYDDPKIVVAVIVEHGGFGSSAAAPIAKKVFKAFLTGRADVKALAADKPKALGPWGERR